MIDCFVSYCGDDADDVHVEKLVEELRRRTNNEVNFRVYYEQEYGSSLKDFMRVVLLESSAVIILFGPQYKQRIEENRSKSGVFQEYDTIVSRLEDLTAPRSPKIIPVLWAGKSVEDVFPEYFQAINLRACDLRGYRAVGMTQERPLIPKPIQAAYATRLGEIADQLKVVAQVGGDEALAGRTAMLDRFLTPDSGGASHKHRNIKDILEIKYELGTYDPKEFRDRYFTSTRYFRHLSTRNVGLISGRKGSGKTTLVQIGELDARDSEYFPVIDITVEKWNIHYLIQGNTYKQSEGDFEYVDLEIRLFDYIWPCFTGLCMCYSLLREHNGPTVKPHDLIISSRVADRLKDVLHGSPSQAATAYQPLFTLAVQCAKDFIQDVVDGASSDSEAQFRMEVLSGISIKNFLFSLFGSNFDALKAALYLKGNRRFLFCLDRFDNEIQQYRKHSIEHDDKMRGERIRREIDWLSSLTLFVHKTLRPDQLCDDKDVFEFFSRVKFLVVLPYDRLIELRNAQRDSVANETIEEIRWQPKELLTMMRKRIQVLHNIDDEKLDKQKYKTPQERFSRIQEMTYPMIPNSVPVVIANRRFDMELFLNVLRHSFFRPRDILIHFASILSYVDTMAKRGRKPEIEAIREAISAETRTIVNFEFIGELRDTWSNIEEVLGLFRGGKQLLDARDLVEIIGSAEFVFYDEAASMVALGEKIDFLYKIGFLGYRFSRQSASYRLRREFVFSFLSAKPPPVFDGESSVKQFEFAIHPIFIDSLYLQTNVDEPVLNLNWKALEALDRVD